MKSTETVSWDMSNTWFGGRKKIAKLLMRTFTCRSLSYLFYGIDDAPCPSQSALMYSYSIFPYTQLNIQKGLEDSDVTLFATISILRN